MAENKSPAFQFYYKEWLTGTKGMNRVERDIYLTLLIFQFDSNNKLNADLENLIRITESKSKKEKNCLNYILKNKFQIIDGFLINNKMAKVIQQVDLYKEKQKLNGKKGGRPEKAVGYSGLSKSEPKKSTTTTTTTTTDILLKKESKGESDFNLDFVEDKFIISFTNFITFRKRFEKPFKTQMAVECCYRDLISLCENNPVKAKLIIDQSIKNEWVDLYEIKQGGSKQGQNQPLTTSINYGKK